MEQIIFNGEPRFTETVEIEGLLYVVNLDYSTTEQQWLFSITGATETEKILGLVLPFAIPVLKNFRNRFKFKGDFFVLPESYNDNAAVETGRLSFETMTQDGAGLYYVSDTELNEVLAAL